MLFPNTSGTCGWSGFCCEVSPLSFATGTGRILRAEVYDAAEKAQSASPSSCNSIPTSTKGLSLYPGYIGLSLFCGRVCNSLSGWMWLLGSLVASVSSSVKREDSPMPLRPVTGCVFVLRWDWVHQLSCGAPLPLCEVMMVIKYVWDSLPVQLFGSRRVEQGPLNTCVMHLTVFYGS